MQRRHTNGTASQEHQQSKTQTEAQYQNMLQHTLHLFRKISQKQINNNSTTSNNTENKSDHSPG